MGADGAEGLKEMLENGAPTLVQDEKSSVVWGMPGEAFKIGAAQDQYPLENIAFRELPPDAKFDCTSRGEVL